MRAKKAGKKRDSKTKVKLAKLFKIKFRRYNLRVTEKKARRQEGRRDMKKQLGDRKEERHEDRWGDRKEKVQ